MKKGMLFGLAHREKRVKKINLLHFPVFTSKNFVILKLPEPSTNCARTRFRTNLLLSRFEKDKCLLKNG